MRPPINALCARHQAGLLPLRTSPARAFLLALSLAGAWAAAGPAIAQVQFGWSHEYPNAGFYYPPSLVVDAQSNLCVLSTADNDFVTLKYAANGTALWTKRYGGPLLESSVAVATDAAGAVWATGNSRTNTSSVDSVITTLKYTPDGTLSWSQTFRETNATAAIASTLAVDGSGNAYVGGASTLSMNPIFLQTCLLVKYSPTGQELWSRRYIPVSGGSVAIKFLALDPDGNVVVSGDLHRGLGAGSLFVVKYSPDGDVLWAKEEVDHESDHGSAFLTGLKVDGTGNIFLAGSVLRASGNSLLIRYHYLTAKYSPTGERLWAVARPPANGYGAVTRALEVDSAGNAVVTGYEYFPVDEDEDEYNIVTVKYDANGAELWSARSTFDREPTRIALDAEGNVYVGGVFRTGSLRTLLLKYASNGSQVWEQEVPGTLPGDLKVAPSGTVCLVGPALGGSGALLTQAYFQTDNPNLPMAVITPSDADVISGSNVTLTAQVSGTGPFTYQWRWFGYTLPGQTDATLVVSKTPVTFLGDATIDYTVLVSNAVGHAISPEARLAFHSPAAIRSPPQSFTVTAGMDVAFFATVSGSPPLTLQWRFNGLDLPGATNAALNLLTVTESQSGAYTLVVSNAYASTNSLPYPLTVLSPPLAFVRQPAQRYARPGGTVTFDVRATGTQPLSYQWYFNSQIFPGATAPSLTVPNAQTEQVGNYFLTVTDVTGVITSRVARLVLIPGSVLGANTQSISIRDDTSADPYPSKIEIVGATSTVAKVIVSLEDVSHPYLSDLDVLLVGPNGNSVILMSDAAGGSEARHATFVFDAGAESQMPESVPLSGGTFRPTNNDYLDFFLPPAPSGPSGTRLSVFNGTDPNGIWSLYVMDDNEDEFGAIAGGWRLTLLGPADAPESGGLPTLRGQKTNDAFVIEIKAEADLPFRLQASDPRSPTNINWVTLRSFTNAHPDTTLRYNDASTFPRRFYRVVSP